MNTDVNKCNQIVCPVCDGSGDNPDISSAMRHIYHNPCHECWGTGVIMKFVPFAQSDEFENGV